MQGSVLSDCRLSFKEEGVGEDERGDEESWKWQAHLRLFYCRYDYHSTILFSSLTLRIRDYEKGPYMLFLEEK